MNAIIKPIALGVAAYIVTAVGLWFVSSLVLMPFASTAAWLLPAAITIVPLFVSGYVAASYTRSRYRSRRVAFGVVAGTIGFAIALLVTQAHGLPWFFGLLFIGAAVVAAAGGVVSTREHQNAHE